MIYRHFTGTSNICSSKVATFLAKSGETSPVCWMAWIYSEDFPRYKELFQNVTYREWLEESLAKVRDFRQKLPHAEFKFVVIRPNKFITWCEEQGLEPSARSRVEYVISLVTSNEPIEILEEISDGR